MFDIFPNLLYKYDMKDLSASWPAVLKLIWGFVGERKSAFVFWNVALALAFLYFLIPPFIVGKIVDFFIDYKPDDDLTIFYIYTAVLGVSMFGATLLRLAGKRVLSNIRSDVKYNARVQGFENLLRQSLLWHQNENTGNKVERITSGTAAIDILIRGLYSDVYRLGAGVVGVVVVFIFIGLQYLVFLLVFLALFYGLFVMFRRKLNQLLREHNQVKEVASGAYYEGLSNIQSIKSLGAGVAVSAAISKKEDIGRVYEKQRNLVTIWQWRSLHFINAIFSVVFLLLIGYNVQNNAITPGDIFVFFAYFANLILSADNSLGFLREIIDAKQTIGRMSPIYHTKNTSNIGGDFAKNWGSLSLKKVSFSYDDNNNSQALSDISIRIKRGSHVGIAGASGSGKSTLSKLLLGLYTPNNGTIYVNKKPYSTISNDNIIKNVSVVPQESELFNMSLFENITMLRDISSSELLKALRIAQLENFVDSLPAGLTTVIGEKGYKVSGGERQRIAIARALVKNAPILILDEASSHLDTKTEKALYDALRKQLRGTTIITIAHRLSTLKKTNRIYVLQKGAVAEHGAYSELLKADGLFAQLEKSQNS